MGKKVYNYVSQTNLTITDRQLAKFQFFLNNFKTYQLQLDVFVVDCRQLPVRDGLIFSARNEIRFLVLAGSNGQHGVTVAHADGESVCLQVVDLKFQMLILNQSCSSTN